MCFGGRGEDSEAKRSREIDALIHRDEKVMQKVVKLLLLGRATPPTLERRHTIELNADCGVVQVPERAESRQY